MWPSGCNLETSRLPVSEWDFSGKILAPQIGDIAIRRSDWTYHYPYGGWWIASPRCSLSPLPLRDSGEREPQRWFVSEP